MHRHSATYLLIAAVLLNGCSTTRLLGPDEYRLAKNRITVSGDKRFNPNEITPYLKQQSNRAFLFGWNPFLYIYNWSDGSDKWPSRMWRKIGEAPVVFSSSAVDDSRQNIIRHLDYLGYYNSDVKSDVKKINKKVIVSYDVRLGTRYVIDSVFLDVPMPAGFKSDFLADSLNLNELRGSFLSEKALEEESARSSSRMRNLGWYGFNKNNYSFEADTLEGNGKARLHYNVMNHTRNELRNQTAPLRKYHIGEIEINRPKSLPFSDYVLTGLSLIHPGDIYDESKVNDTYGRYSSLKVFNSVGIEMTPADSNVVNCKINLTQSKVQGFKLNLEASVNSTGLMGISPNLNYFHKNIFHGGEWLNLGFMGNFQFKFNDADMKSDEFGVSASLSLPRLLGIPYKFYKNRNIPRSEFKISFSYQDRPEFKRNMFSTSIGFSSQSINNLTLQLYPLQVNYVRLPSMSDEFRKSLEKNPFMRYTFKDHLDAGIGGTIYHSTSLDLVPSVSHRYFRFNFDLSGNVLAIFRNGMNKDSDGSGTLLNAPFSQFVRGEFTFGKTWRMGKRNGTAIATRFLLGAGYAYGNSTAMPYEKQFFCGGASSMRGWQTRSLGPGYNVMNSSFVIPSQTGDMKLELNAEYRQLLFWKLEAAIFADIGNIWTLGNNDTEEGIKGQFRIDDFYNSLAGDWGFGLRANLNFIVLRLDMGLKVRDPSCDPDDRWKGPSQWFKKNGFALNFGIGYPF